MYITVSIGTTRTHLKHYFVDSSSIRFEVERLVVMVTKISELKYCMTCNTERKTCLRCE